MKNSCFKFASWDVLARLYFLIEASTLISLVAFSKQSLTARFIGAENFISALLLICIVGVALDLIINDLMPPKYSCKPARHHRYVLFMIAGYCYFAQAFVGYAAGYYILSSKYVLEGLMCGLLACTFLRQEWRIKMEGAAK